MRLNKKESYVDDNDWSDPDDGGYQENVPTVEDSRLLELLNKLEKETQAASVVSRCKYGLISLPSDNKNDMLSLAVERQGDYYSAYSYRVKFLHFLWLDDTMKTIFDIELTIAFYGFKYINKIENYCSGCYIHTLEKAYRTFINVDKDDEDEVLERISRKINHTDVNEIVNLYKKLKKTAQLNSKTVTINNQEANNASCNKINPIKDKKTEPVVSLDSTSDKKTKNKDNNQKITKKSIQSNLFNKQNSGEASMLSIEKESKERAIACKAKTFFDYPHYLGIDEALEEKRFVKNRITFRQVNKRSNHSQNISSSNCQTVSVAGNSCIFFNNKWSVGDYRWDTKFGRERPSEAISAQYHFDSLIDIDSFFG